MTDGEWTFVWYQTKTIRYTLVIKGKIQSLMVDQSYSMSLLILCNLKIISYVFWPKNKPQLGFLKNIFRDSELEPRESNHHRNQRTNFMKAVVMSF